MSQKEIREILQNYRTVAVVGLSSDENKPSHEVAKYMQEQGYRVIPVNPTLTEVLGEKSYPSLADMPAEVQETVEVVDIFRRPENVLPVVEQAIKLKAKYGNPFVVWMQLGIVNEAAAKAARKAGIVVGCRLRGNSGCTTHPRQHTVCDCSARRLLDAA